MRRFLQFLIFSALLAGWPVHANQDAALAPSCPATEAALEPVWSGWGDPVPLDAARSLGEVPAATVVVGRATRLALHPDAEVFYASLPQGEGEAASFGGMARFTISQEGLYGVGTGSSVWIDVSRSGEPEEAVAFGRGVRCMPIRKVVSFQLEPGDYVLEISGSEVPEVDVMLAAEGVPIME